MCNNKFGLNILIPTRDRPHRLAMTLASLGAQDFSMIKGRVVVYILDNGAVAAVSQADVARHLDALELRGIQTFYRRYSNARGIFWVRRELYLNSSQPIVCYLDDDIALGPNVLSDLYHGITKEEISLASGFLVDVDGLYPDVITVPGHRLREAINNMIQCLKTDNIHVLGVNWIEMIEPTGGLLMFRRSDFESVGAWEKMRSHYETEPNGWAEDTALCVSLKGINGAFVNIQEISIHFSPETRYFPEFEQTEGNINLLKSIYGAEYPSQIPVKHIKATRNIEPVINILNKHIQHIGETL